MSASRPLAQIERLLTRDGRPLDSIGIVSEQTGTRWTIEILDRLALLERLDTRARLPDTGGEGARIVKDCAAWIRGLPPRVCPELFRHDNGDGTWNYQRGTIERAPDRKTGRSGLKAAPRRSRGIR